MTVDAFTSVLQRALATAPDGPLRVGYSGGMDSTVLLHALAHLPDARARGLGAIHVDHGLHADSQRWAEHCAATCGALGVALDTVSVQVADIAPLGLEAAARAARRRAFAALLPVGALLALAQHRDDQAETLLLRLLHGAGHEGLAGMRGLRRFDPGWLWRPLLALGRAELAGYATRHGLTWVDDPSNADARHARNHLRHAVLPALASRWPDAAARIAAAAARLGEEAEVLESLAQRELAQAQGVDPATLSVAALKSLPLALRRAALGRWLDQLGLPRPPPGLWSRLEPDLLRARADATPLLAWHGAELRRHRDSLHAMRPLPPAAEDWSRDWTGATPLSLPAGFGSLALDPAVALPTMRVGARRGGERLQQAGARRELRTLLQDLGVPPWVRARLPLLWSAEGELLAAADLALAPGFEAQQRAAQTRLRWAPPD
jgi:tRNA(Ile)-lysidine synthase